ncbi:hypothetical protein [Nesterenkonia pannonica]|nr:hypothetical protein [Nesterenkonia pannonica]
MERAHAVVRDDVIFSLGFGRTPQGKFKQRSSASSPDLEGVSTLRRR